MSNPSTKQATVRVRYRPDGRPLAETLRAYLQGLASSYGAHSKTT